MPRPEYRDPDKKTVYIQKVSPEIMAKWLDICYKLDKSQQDAFPDLVEYFYDREKVKPRPRNKKS